MWLRGLDVAECNMISVFFSQLKVIFLPWKRLTCFLGGHILGGVCAGTQEQEFIAGMCREKGNFVNMCNYNYQSLPGNYFLLLSLWCPAAVHTAAVFVGSDYTCSPYALK